MSRKIRLPDEDIEPVWDKMSAKDRDWYEEFKKATEYHNWKSLRYLCDIAPTDQYERIMSEIQYELQSHERARYEIPKKYNSTYTEWDYSWAPTRSTKTVSRQDHIEKSYDAPATSKNMKWAK